MACHNSVEGCSCGNEPCTECPECQIDLEMGAWWRREGKVESILLRQRLDNLGSKISQALNCSSIAEVRNILAPQEGIG